MTETNKEILRRANAAISRGDHEGFLALCSEDTEWVFVGDRTLRGKEEVRQYLAEIYLEPPRFEVAHLIAEGDWVTALGTITLKDGDGKDVDHAYCDVWRFRDGRMVQLKAFVIEEARVKAG